MTLISSGLWEKVCGHRQDSALDPDPSDLHIRVILGLDTLIYCAHTTVRERHLGKFDLEIMSHGHSVLFWFVVLTSSEGLA